MFHRSDIKLNFSMFQDFYYLFYIHYFNRLIDFNRFYGVFWFVCFFSGKKNTWTSCFLWWHLINQHRCKTPTEHDVLSNRVLRSGFLWQCLNYLLWHFAVTRKGTTPLMAQCELGHAGNHEPQCKLQPAPDPLLPPAHVCVCLSNCPFQTVWAWGILRLKQGKKDRKEKEKMKRMKRNVHNSDNFLCEIEVFKVSIESVWQVYCHIDVSFYECVDAVVSMIHALFSSLFRQTFCVVLPKIVMLSLTSAQSKHPGKTNPLAMFLQQRTSSSGINMI